MNIFAVMKISLVYELTIVCSCSFSSLDVGEKKIMYWQNEVVIFLSATLLLMTFWYQIPVVQLHNLFKHYSEQNMVDDTRLLMTILTRFAFISHIGI